MVAAEKRWSMAESISALFSYMNVAVFFTDAVLLLFCLLIVMFTLFAAAAASFSAFLALAFSFRIRLTTSAFASGFIGRVVACVASSDRSRLRSSAMLRRTRLSW